MSTASPINREPWLMLKISGLAWWRKAVHMERRVHAVTETLGQHAARGAVTITTRQEIPRTSGYRPNPTGTRGLVA